MRRPLDDGRRDRNRRMPAMWITRDALELAFRIVLSCPCDVTHEQERAVFDYLAGLPTGGAADLGPVLDAFDGDSPFHGLASFAGWMAADPSAPTIERHHVLRCNASGYHWQHASATLPTASRRVSSVSRWLLSHMVVPVSLDVAGGAARADYRFEGGAAVLENVFLPSEFDAGSSPVWALHLGAVVGPLDAAEALLVSRLNEANPQLIRHRTRVSRVDYADFELQGDQREFCRRRHAPFWGDGVPSGAA
jgi:hypothetical protein